MLHFIWIGQLMVNFKAHKFIGFINQSKYAVADVRVYNQERQLQSADGQTDEMTSLSGLILRSFPSAKYLINNHLLT